MAHTKDKTAQVCSFLGVQAARRVLALPADKREGLTEIRLRIGKPMQLRVNGQNFNAEDFLPAQGDITETLERISRHSYYAFEAELAQGYITLSGGHRVGVAGQVVCEGGIVRAFRHISGLCVRIAHSVEGCADKVLPKIYDGGSFCNTIIISPPGFGKTTLLRDIVRQVSNAGETVGVVDERSEIAGCYEGIAQNDVGLFTDVLDACPKAEGMVMLLRAMSPRIIAVDELGGEKDAAAVAQALNAGVKLLCSAHGYEVGDIPENLRIFDRYIVLDAPARIKGVYDAGGALC
ncbi:MAG: stage III sporulation protein AA [Defluviitaleaceae bacterium]|nr:stage III sporulation protein AA [Defluviitaleaceae bacterium]MCL2274637.1 stage III sporulation protein AA [Defluviitaleaceae bacterium]